MPINALIAQGIKPFGADLPDISLALNRNRLAQQEVDQRQQAYDLDQQQFDAQQQARTDQQEAITQEQARNFVGAGIHSLEAVANDPVKWAQVADQIAAHPLSQKLGITRDRITPESVTALRTQLGMGPAATPITYEQINGPRGSIMQKDSTGKLSQVVGPDNTQPAAAQPKGVFRTLSAEEVAAKGLPAGTVAQEGPDGQLHVITKRDQSAVVSQRDQTTARNKLTALKVAKQQLEVIKEKFATGRQGVNAFGPGQGLLPTQQGKAFDAAVDQMRSTLTSLTRTPGVGAMSDYETKLDQSKFPARNAYEAVTEQKIQGIEDLLATLETGYTDLLGGGQAAPESPAAPVNRGASGGWTVTEVK